VSIGALVDEANLSNFIPGTLYFAQACFCRQVATDFDEIGDERMRVDQHIIYSK
jgi:hypothetical protein